jgi:hypothetical protein
VTAVLYQNDGNVESQEADGKEGPGGKKEGKKGRLYDSDFFQADVKGPRINS